MAVVVCSRELDDVELDDNFELALLLLLLVPGTDDVVVDNGLDELELEIGDCEAAEVELDDAVLLVTGLTTMKVELLEVTVTLWLLC